MATSGCRTSMIRILVVEPDPIYRKLFSIWIRNHFGGATVEVRAAAGPNDAEEAALRFRPQVLLTAYELEGSDGLRLARRLRRLVGELRVILISQTAYACLQKRLNRSPRTRFLAKPVGENTFVHVVEDTLRDSVANGSAP